MYLEDGKTAANIGFIEHHLAIKASRTHQGRIEDVRAVGSSYDNNVGLFIKAI